MNRRITLLLAALATLVAAAVPAGAQEAEERRFEEIPLEGVDTEFLPALADPNRTLSVMVEMNGEPVAAAQGAAIEQGGELSRGQRAALRATLKSAQDAIVPEIRRLGGRVQSQLQDAYNGIRVRVPARQVARIAALPGVAAVRPMEVATPDNTSSVPFLQTPGVWENLGFTGEGVTIGIIDSGIDYYHANFGGSGDPGDYAADDRTVIEPGTFPTVKVAGGMDFVGDDYDAASDDPALNTPVPDPDPLDCGGHGSHVAGTAAGNGVLLLDRSTYSGAYDSTTHDNSFLIGPGVAPDATLYALKVFGCDGGTDAVVDAINWAVAQDLDVINLSLGSPFGRAEDPMSVAATNAALSGVVVVASAGNFGRGEYITGTPGAGAGVISVAAMDTIRGTPHARFVTDARTIDMQNSNASTLLPVSGEVVVMQDDPATSDVDESLGCSAADYAGIQPGQIAVTHRGGCARSDRIILGQAAGAGAVVMINNASGLPPFEGNQGAAIPFLGAGPIDEAAILAAAGQTVSIEEGDIRFNPNFARLGDFSSNGPRNGDSGQKPDVTAPGVNIVSTGAGTGYSTNQITGTSMAAPYVAGVAALVREARPKWKATHVKAAIINTADPNRMLRGLPDFILDQYLTARAGSGVVVPADAVVTEVVATGERTGGGLSFGVSEATGLTVDTRSITVHNRGDQTATYGLSTDWNTDAGFPAMTFSADTVTVPARGKATVGVTLRVDASAAPGGDEPGGFLARELATAAGNVVLTPTADGEPVLRVPFVMAVRGISTISTSPRRVSVADQVSFTATNAAGSFAPFEVFAWGLSDPRGDALATDLRNVGVQAFPESDFGVFAIHAGNTVSNPSINEWDVLLDTDGDDTPDFGVVGHDLGVITRGVFSGNTLGSITIDLDTRTIVRAFSAFADLNSGVVQLPFLLSDVGLAAGQQEEFNYSAGVISLEGLGDDIVDGTAQFNPFTQPVQTGQLGFAFPGFPVEWTATVDAAQLAETPVKGWLVVYRFNKGGVNQAETIRLRRW